MADEETPAGEAQVRDAEDGRGGSVLDAGYLAFLDFLWAPQPSGDEALSAGVGAVGGKDTVEAKNEERDYGGDYRDLIKEKRLEKKVRDAEQEQAQEQDELSEHLGNDRFDPDDSVRSKRSSRFDADGSTSSRSRRGGLGRTASLARVPSLARMGSMTSLPSIKKAFSPRNIKRKKKKDFHYRTRRPPPPIEHFHDEAENASRKNAKRLTPWLSYEVFQWTWFLVLTALAIADRFSWNVWPRQTYSIGAGSAGSDRTVGYKPGPWSVVFYDALARVSGRYSIICYNFILITRLECLEHLLTAPFVKNCLLDTSNIVNANTRLHYWNGIGLCVMTMLHVWSILFPCVTHGYTAVVVPGVFEWPLSERTPVKCSVSDEPGCWPGDANPELKQMGLQADDVFRMVEMTLFLCILMPISVRWFASKWHAGIQLHRLINLVYFVDIVRRHSHPHSWILNTPIFVLYIFDKYIFTYYYKRNKSPIMKRVHLGKDFMVLYWKSPHGFTDTVGPDYSLLMNDSSILEEKHIFTCFENRSGVCLDSDCDDEEIGEGDIDGKNKDSFQWTVGVVIRVFRRPRVPQLGRKDAISHTQRIYEEDPLMLVTGPRQGEMSERVRLELLSTNPAPLMLFGAGSAVNFIIDALQWCSTGEIPKRRRISLVYTTRDYDLFQWSMGAISTLVPLCEERGVFFDVKMAYTGPLEDGDSQSPLDDSEGSPRTAKTAPLDNSVKMPLKASLRGIDSGAQNAQAMLDDSVKSVRSIESRNKSVKTQPMRFDLYGEIYPGSTVFCQGSAGLKAAVEGVCKKVNARFYGGRGGSREDQV